MIRTHICACHLPQAEADALNRESGRVYSETVIYQSGRAFQRALEACLLAQSTQGAMALVRLLQAQPGAWR